MYMIPHFHILYPFSQAKLARKGKLYSYIAKPTNIDYYAVQTETHYIENI